MCRWNGTKPILNPAVMKSHLFFPPIPYAPRHISHYLHYTKGNLDRDMRATVLPSENNTPPKTHHGEIYGGSYSRDTYFYG